MWCALGENYERLSQDGKFVSRLEDAIHCYLRAEAHDDVEGVALNKLAQLFRRRGQITMAAEYYAKVLKRHGVEPNALVTIETKPAADQIHASVHNTPTVFERSTSTQLAQHTSDNLTTPIATTGAANHTFGSSMAFHPDAVEAMLFLAEYHFKHLHQYEQAEAYCNRLLDIGSVTG